jgi:DNA-directed RNA polymerase II subunit RPB1
LNYEKKTNVGNEPIVKIYKGVLIEGNITKAIIGNTTGSLLHVLEKEYTVDKASIFIDNIQFITNSFLTIYGFSVGIEDCLIPGAISGEKKQEIDSVIKRCYIEAEGIKTTTNHPNIREIRVTAALNKAKDSGFRIAKQSLSPKNNFIKTVESGSKGDWFNIAQITGLLGQQNLMGSRVKPIFNGGKRTLPHYPFEDLSVEMEYESKGFIASSFIKGLNPREFFFHAMSGREGVCDTAMGTARSGYIQRRIIKLTEDIKVRYDGTVRDDIGRVYQYAYGDDGFDPSKTVQVGKEQELCNIERIIGKMNLEYEMNES